MIRFVSATEKNRFKLREQKDVENHLHHYFENCSSPLLSLSLSLSVCLSLSLSLCLYLSLSISLSNSFFFPFLYVLMYLSNHPPLYPSFSHFLPAIFLPSKPNAIIPVPQSLAPVGHRYHSSDKTRVSRIPDLPFPRL